MQVLFDILSSFFTHKLMRVAPFFLPLIMIIASDTLWFMIVCAIFIVLHYYFNITEVLLQSASASMHQHL